MVETPPFDIVTARVLDGVAHGFFGHSRGAYQFGYGGDGEEPEIRRTRARAARAIVTGGKLVAPRQVHSPDALVIDAPWRDTAGGRPVADALVTATPGLALGILTADCAPVLFADGEAGVVGAAHTGWRGAVGGVLENTVKAMESQGARRERIVAVIGPAIAQASYEVDEMFRKYFPQSDQRFFRAIRAGRWQFGLGAFILARLEAAGMKYAMDRSLDAYTLKGTYYSYRRARHRGGPGYGRQISIIGLS